MATFEATVNNMDAAIVSVSPMDPLILFFLTGFTALAFLFVLLIGGTNEKSHEERAGAEEDKL